MEGPMKMMGPSIGVGGMENKSKEDAVVAAKEDDKDNDGKLYASKLDLIYLVGVVEEELRKQQGCQQQVQFGELRRDCPDTAGS